MSGYARSAEDLPPRIARGMLWTALGLLLLVRLLVWTDDGVPPESMALTAAPYPPLILILMRRWRARPRVRYGALVALAALSLLPFAVIGTGWEWLPWPVAAGVLCVLPIRAALPLFTAILIATGAGGVLAGEAADAWHWRVSATGIDSLIVFSLYALAAMVTDLHAAHDEQARLATLRERLRVDGELRATVDADLRDIAGTLRRAAQRAASAEPGLARDGLREATATARRALAGIRATASGYRAAVPLASTPIRSPRLARLILLAVLLLQAEKAVTRVWVVPRDRPLLFLVIPALTGAIVLFMRPPSPWRVALIALLVVPLAWPGAVLAEPLAGVYQFWGFLIGAALVGMRPPWSWAVVAGVFGLTILLFFFPPPVPSLPGAAANLISEIILAWVVYTLTRLADLVVLLRRARDDLARAAVTAERTRIGRDLHDVLGFSLSAVALRGELAATLVEHDPERARSEVATLIELVERSRSELGSITSGRIRLLLSREVDSALEVLAAAGVDADARVETGALPVAVDTALAAMLRESVTNVLRHSDARTCAITITRGPGGVVRLSVVNDGAASAGVPRLGSGLKGLAERSGGRLSAGPRPGGRFEVVAEFDGPASDPAGLGGDADGVDPVAGVQLGDR
ncbi:hypothetical protein J4573_18525 [Actinomadura barringtoniae]|uniref:histidine kinase n=1 Tax=Actinomadura barringtoniae TaxID=1427535 RepID=A0A939T275_9ACTN|nr:histidine kinase [Actinomadura barringtoniae]MBO2449106.1 hypothetical protein [Actinomadura barringtoniae]